MTTDHDLFPTGTAGPEPVSRPQVVRLADGDWPWVDRDLTLTLDDLLVEDGHVAAFGRSGPNATAMGRFGNVPLVDGETAFTTTVAVGEVVRLILVDTADTRLFLVWSDTVLLRAGQTVDLLLAVSNPGSWMARCHIAEHTGAA